MNIFVSLMVTPFEAISVTFFCTLVPVLYWRRRLSWQPEIKWLYWLLLLGLIFRLVTCQHSTGRYNLFLVPIIIILTGWQIVRIGDMLADKFHWFAKWQKLAILLSFSALFIGCGIKSMRTNRFNRYIINGAQAIVQADSVDRDLIINFGKHGGRLEYYTHKRVLTLPEQPDTHQLIATICKQVGFYKCGVDRIWLVIKLKADEVEGVSAELEQALGCRRFYRRWTNNSGKHELVIFQYDVPQKSYSFTPMAQGESIWQGESATGAEIRKIYAKEISQGVFSPEQDWERFPREWTINFTHMWSPSGDSPNLILTGMKIAGRPVLELESKWTAAISRIADYPLRDGESLVISCEDINPREIHIGWYLKDRRKIFMRYEEGGVFFLDPLERLTVEIPVKTKEPAAGYWTPIITARGGGKLTIYEVNRFKR